MKCAYGCGRTAKHQFKNGVRCCESHRTKCPAIKEKTAWNRGKRLSKDHREALSRSKKADPRTRLAGAKGNAEVKRRYLIPLAKILVENSTYKSSKLKRRCIEAGLLEDKCFECGNGPVWNKKPLVLQLDHINGVRSDNRIENLRILCPNCHTQTPTYAAKNRSNKKRVKRVSRYLTLNQQLGEHPAR